MKGYPEHACILILKWLKNIGLKYHTKNTKILAEV